MMLIFLSPTEALVVREGRLNDPRYSPLSDDPVDDETTDSRTAAIRAVTVNARSQYWTRHTPQRVVLIGMTSGEPSVIGVGLGEPNTLRRGQGVAVIKISAIHPLSEPIAISGLAAGMPRRARTTLRDIIDARESRSVPPSTSETLRAALISSSPEFDEAWRSVPIPPVAPRRLREPQDLPLVDASQTALRLFSKNWHRLEPIESPSGVSAVALSADEHLRASENDYITDDASSFLDWTPERGTIAGWYEFHDQGRRLLVKNVNVSTAEAATGADLVYLRRDPDAVVLVQYKLLEAGANGTDLVFRDAGGRLANQVKRMLQFSAAASDPPANEPDVRIGADIGFVKFIHPGATSVPVARDVIPAGHYFPARSVQLHLARPRRGPRGGEIHLPTTWRSIDGETFVRLVRDQWLGSRGDITKKLKQILGILPAAQSVTVAVDEPS